MYSHDQDVLIPRLQRTTYRRHENSRKYIYSYLYIFYVGTREERGRIFSPPRAKTTTQSISCCIVSQSQDQSSQNHLACNRY